LTLCWRSDVLVVSPSVAWGRICAEPRSTTWGENARFSVLCSANWATQPFCPRKHAQQQSTTQPR